MTRKEKLLKLYKQFERTGQMNDHGLCNVLNDVYDWDDYWELVPMIRPQNIDQHDTYWGDERGMGYFGAKDFTPLRATLLALIIAMETEKANKRKTK
jgi:hypothetical protein